VPHLSCEEFCALSNSIGYRRVQKNFFVQFAFEIWHFGTENDILTPKVSLEIEKMDEKNFLTEIHFW